MPEYSATSSVQSSFITSIASARRASRSPTGAKGMPRVANSRSACAAPIPISRRPSEKWSTVAAILARRAGCLYRFPVTLTPIRTLRVRAAMQASVVQLSKMGSLTSALYQPVADVLSGSR